MNSLRDNMQEFVQCYIDTEKKLESCPIEVNLSLMLHFNALVRFSLSMGKFISSGVCGGWGRLITFSGFRGSPDIDSCDFL